MPPSNADDGTETVTYDERPDPRETGTTTVELPAPLVSRVDARLDRTNYDSAGEYVAFVLEETLARVEAETDDETVDVDQSEVQDRLESLGYLDS